MAEEGPSSHEKFASKPWTVHGFDPSAEPLETTTTPSEQIQRVFGRHSDGADVDRSLRWAEDPASSRTPRFFRLELLPRSVVLAAMRSVRLFFAIALGGVWAFQAPALLFKLGVLHGDEAPYVALAGLGGFSPLVAALIAAKVEGPGKARALFAAFRMRAGDAGWYLAALAAFPAIHVAGEATYRALGGSSPGAWLYLPTTAQHVTAMILIPFVEEIGWRGFAMPRLTERYGVLRASAVVGVAWAGWHAVMFVLQGFSPLVFAASMAMIFAGSFVFGWLFLRSRGSLWVAVLAHLGVHIDNPTRALEQSVTPYLVFVAASIVAWAVAAVAMRGRSAAG
ncbi:MAG: CPBP family intramembrane metalloprotease [Myxococcales bacterium]|nr:CPBP family intramembrane metalloprotease [Myxococcales bacterium]